MNNKYVHIKDSYGSDGIHEISNTHPKQYTNSNVDLIISEEIKEALSKNHYKKACKPEKNNL